MKKLRIYSKQNNKYLATYIIAPSLMLSERACLNVFSESNTPHVAWSTESRRQSPAVLFHSAYRRLPSLTVSSRLQLMTSSSSSSINKQKCLLHLTFKQHRETLFVYNYIL